jgi:type IV pilus assembly protein PilF
MLLPIYIVLIVALLQGCSAIESMKASEEKDHRIAKTHVDLGIGYMKQGKYDAALEKLKKAVNAEPGYAPGHSAIAIVYERLEKHDLADKHYREAISLDPDNGGLQNNYGVFLCGQKKYEQAEKYFLKAIATPRYATPELAYENAGVCERKSPKADSKKAEEYLQNALKQNPQLPLALLNMAFIRFEQENFLSARGFLQRFEVVSRHTAESLWLGVLVERKLKNDEAVQNYAKQLQTNFPKSEQFKLLLNSQGET